MYLTADPVIDSTLVAEVVTLIESILGLFTVFPLNVFLIGAIGTVGFKWIKQARSVAK